MNKEDRDFITALLKDIPNHSDPSPQTMEMFKNVNSSLSDLKSDVKELKNSIDSKYAAKWVEWIAKGMVAAILLYFLAGILGGFKIQTVSQAIGNIISLFV